MSEDIFIVFEQLIERIFISNVVGYKILIDQYLVYNEVINYENLASVLFDYQLGTDGLRSYLNAELTYTLPGFTYAFGGFFFTTIFSIFIGILASFLDDNLQSSISSEFSSIISGFILIQIVQLVNRGYLINFIKIPVTSLIIILIFMFLIIKLNNVRPLIKWKEN